MLRDGLEDYEYLAILQRLLSCSAAIDVAASGGVQALLEVPPAITAS